MKLIYSILVVFVFLTSFQACSYSVLEDTLTDEELALLKSQLIAHRGAWTPWTPHKIPENSLASLKKAIALGVYGAEFDIRQTKDDSLIVCHDDTHRGLKIHESTFAQLRQLPLENGEKIPTLYELIQEVIKYPKFKLIVEVKHADIDKVVNLIERCNVANQIEFFSFSLPYCMQLLSHNKNYKVSLLQGFISINPITLKELGFHGVAYHYNVFWENPDLVQSATAMELTTYAWTVNNVKDIFELIDMGVDYIITDILTCNLRANH